MVGVHRSHQTDYDNPAQVDTGADPGATWDPASEADLRRGETVSVESCTLIDLPASAVVLPFYYCYGTRPLFCNTKELK